MKWQRNVMLLLETDSSSSDLDYSGTSKGDGSFQSGSMEASYEIDTLRLVTMSFGLWGGKNKSDGTTNTLATFPGSIGHRPQPRQLFLRFYPADLCAGMYLYEDEYRRSHNRPHTEWSRRFEPGRQHRQYRGGKERRLCGAEHGQLPFPALLRGDELCTHHGEGRRALSGALKQKTNTLYLILKSHVSRFNSQRVFE